MPAAKDQVDLVQESWAIASKNEKLTEMFYGRMFKTYPDLPKTLFSKVNMKVQQRMLASMLDTAVKNLRNPDTLMPELKALGVRHARYGCRPGSYTCVGESLLWALEQVLQDKWTPEVKAAWVSVYGTMVSVMTAELETEEGKRLLAEYESQNTPFYGPGDKPAACCATSTWMTVALVAVPVVAVAAWLIAKKQQQ